MATLLRGAAFITGAGSGIGQSTAYAMAKYGIKQLALCDITPYGLEETKKQLQERYKGLDILDIEIDVSEEAEVNSAVEEAAKQFGRVDIGINSAGIGGGGTPTDHLDFAEWRKILSVDLDGVMLCQRAQIRQMLKQEFLDPPPRGNRGVIVNVASMLGLVGTPSYNPAVAFVTSKHGVMGLTKVDAAVYAAQGIRINAVCPGYIGTPILKEASDTGVLTAELAKVPQRRLGKPEEVADVIAFMASRMSSFMTGHGLVVDGGFTCT